ncbi:PREDICTED: keratin, type I cytoskeletal 9-like [Dufourea novaeangliae]|uniref:keratin, type I cytoskeletal 9-like n=1 Tax=Dufourea novaeangliae TaxID=178035 RepID=UPI00076755F0|nr:PREDICTED: keratin, type I cytoskeletal 9-like [Dufourea novaeangliae]
MNDYFNTCISQLTSDVIMLKAKLLEMQKMKNSREENYREVIQQYHSTVVKQCSALKDELDEVRVMNESFDNRVVTIDVKLAEIIHGKDEQAKQIEKQCMEKMNALRDQFEKFILERNKELEMKQTLLEKKDFQLSQKDAGRKEDMELLTNKIYELEMKLEMKNNDEEKLQATLIEQYRNMKEEFSKLKSDVDYEIQQQNENLMSKVSELNKTVLKLEKSKQKLGYDYEKKMLHIIQNKDSKIKSLQLQLQEQKNELCRSLTTKQQSEVDNIVTLLEKRYRTLLAETEATTECQTQEYLKKIAALEDLVLSMQKH